MHHRRQKTKWLTMTGQRGRNRVTKLKRIYELLEDATCIMATKTHDDYYTDEYA